jgi:hypothetical protein
VNVRHAFGSAYDRDAAQPATGRRRSARRRRPHAMWTGDGRTLDELILKRTL